MVVNNANARNGDGDNIRSLLANPPDKVWDGRSVPNLHLVGARVCAHAEDWSMRSSPPYPPIPPSTPSASKARHLCVAQLHWPHFSLVPTNSNQRVRPTNT